MTPRALPAFVAVTASLAASASVAAAAPAKAQYLFVVEGDVARMAPVAGAPGAYAFSMPLRNSRHAVTWFTERPVRDAGHITMPAFVGLWSQPGASSFAAIPPNAAITYEAGNARRTVVATMSKPKVAARGWLGTEPALEATMTLVRPARLRAIARGTSHVAAHARRARAVGQVPRILPSPAVFVDGLTGAGGRGGNGGAGGPASLGGNGGNAGNAATGGNGGNAGNAASGGNGGNGG